MRRRRAAIVGGGLGGLAAAVHLAAAGWRVRLVEANERLGGRANRLELGGGRFDTGPSLLDYPWVFEELFACGGADLHDRVRLLPVEPALTFAWRDGERLELSSDVVRLGDEIERFEPGGRERLAGFLADGEHKYRLAFDRLVVRNEDRLLAWAGSLAAASGVRGSFVRSLDAELGRFFRSPRVREALGCYAMYLGGSPYRLPGYFSILPYGEIAHGLWLPEGGIYALVEAIAALARDLGVEIETGRPVERIELGSGDGNGRRVAGLRFADGEIRDEAVVVSNVDLPTTVTRLLADGSDDGVRRRRRAAATRMTPSVTTFYWVVEGRPEGLPHHTVFLPDDHRRAFDDLLERRRIPDDLPFYVAVPSATDPSLAAPGTSTVFVLVPTPVLSALPGADWDEVAGRLEERVFARLAEQGVGLGPEDVRHRETWTPPEWARRFGLHDGSAFGAAHTLGQLGPLRAPNASRRIGGLYYAGAGTTPGTGMPMVTLSGRLAAERIAEREGAGGA